MELPGVVKLAGHRSREEERLVFELLSINSEKVTVLPETIKKENVGDIAYRCR